MLLTSGALVSIREPAKEDLLGPEWSLVWVTLALAIVTGGLFWWTRRLATGAADEAKASAAIAAEALKAANASAKASEAAVTVMQGQLKAADASVQASEAVLRVMQQQLAIANAPKIAVRKATVNPRISIQQRSIVSVTLLLQNTGLSTAVVKEAGFYLDWQNKNQPRQPAKVRPGGEHQLPGGTAIQAGRTLEVTVSHDDFFWPANSAFDMGANGVERQMYFSGCVVYTDEVGQLPPKSTTFYRVYKGGTDNAFEPIGDAGVEYST